MGTRPAPLARVTLPFIAVAAMATAVVATPSAAGAQEQPGGRPGRYVVAAGDTLWSIAQRVGSSVEEIVRLNQIADPDLIHAGQELRLPDADGDGTSGDGAGTYVVRAGDTLAAIAGRFETTVAVLAQANRIADVDLIRVGQRLTIPGASGSDDGAVGELTQTCEAERFTVAYPEGWQVNPGLIADACGWFNREPFEVQGGTELVTDVMLSVEPVDYERILDGLSRATILSAEEIQVDGHEAVRVEHLASGDGFFPEGTRTYQYVVRLGDGEALTASTHSTRDGYRENRDVLDRMIETLEIH